MQRLSWRGDIYRCRAIQDPATHPDRMSPAGPEPLLFQGGGGAAAGIGGSRSARSGNPLRCAAFLRGAAPPATSSRIAIGAVAAALADVIRLGSGLGVPSPSRCRA
jgi:hypothetical protein